MKRKISILLFALLAISVSAQSLPNQIVEGSDECEAIREGINAPYYYCDCRETSTPFQFPLETEVNDTVWYTATADDLKQGISAYWFANSSVTMEVYAFCSSKEPTLKLTVGRNQMVDVDVATINEKLAEMGETVQELLGVVTPRIRVYPNNGGSGKVYCYPYDQGPNSTCDEPLPLRPNMTYVCSTPSNEYELDYSLIPSSGKAFIHWKQDKNKPCTVWLTLDSCSGQEVMRTQLSDSLHVYHLDSALLKQTKTEKRNIWMHVEHPDGYTGRIYFYTNPKYAVPAEPINQSTCVGKTLTANLRKYSTDTAFVDTIWVNKDTLQTMEVNFSFLKSEMQYDTVYVSPAELRRGYRYQPTGTILRSFNDTIIEVKEPEKCTQWIQVTVNSTEAISDIPYSETPIKQIQNGQIVILIENRKYNVLGQQIKK